MFDEKYIERYSRQILLNTIGLEGQEKISNAKIAVAGVGGLGSMVASLLARIGFGEIHLIDRDVVSLSDLHRQILYDEDDLGLPKVIAAETKLKKINSTINIYSHPISVNNLPFIEKLIQKVDVIVDGLDNMRGRYNLNYLAVKNKKPYIFAAAIENYGNISTIIPPDSPCLYEFYGKYSQDENLPSCSTNGVNPAVVTTIASLEVNEAIRIVTQKKPNFFKKLGLLDLNLSSIESIEIKKDPNCDVCNLRFKPLSEPKTEISCDKYGFSTVFINNYIHDLDLEEVITNKKIKPLRKNGKFVSGTIGDVYFTLYFNGYAVFQFKKYDEELAKRAEILYEQIVG